MKTQEKLSMKILGLDSSAIAASCAIVEDGRILASSYINNNKTFSQTLMPLVENTLNSAGLSLSDIDKFAVTNGPGSFTGLRIAVSAVKAMAYANSKPVCPVSTLVALAYNYFGVAVNPSKGRQSRLVCATMDARRNEVYNALFKVNNSAITRLTPDRAIALTDLESELIGIAAEGGIASTSIVGDGAHLVTTGTLSPEHLRLQNAVSVCFVAEQESAQWVSANELMPSYIRKPQAQREREERLQRGTT
jgi:tRNA threonylcarbamoyladenosine biosynthesis protein TsaB